MKLNVYKIFVLFSFIFLTAVKSYPIDFYELNTFIGVCPISKTLTALSSKGSYVGYVYDSDKFAKICPHIEKGTRLTIQNLDEFHWMIHIKLSEIQFRLEDIGYSKGKGSQFKLTKLCDTCPSIPKEIQMAASLKQPEKKAMSSLNDLDEYVLFDFDKYVIKPPYFMIINKFVNELLSNKSLKVELQGHTCSIGAEAYNSSLSGNRAKAVQNYLLKKGVPKSQIVANSFGYSMPRASNGNEMGRAQNRRVEFVRIYPK